MEKPQVLGETASQPHVGQAVALGRAIVSHAEPQRPDATRRPVDDLGVAVRDAQRKRTPASLGVEYPSQKAAAPVEARHSRPTDRGFEDIHTLRRADREHLPRAPRRSLEPPVARFDPDLGEITASAQKGLEVDECESEAASLTACSVASVPAVAPDAAVTPDETAQIAGSVIDCLYRRASECGRPDKFVVGC